MTIIADEKESDNLNGTNSQCFIDSLIVWQVKVVSSMRISLLKTNRHLNIDIQFLSPAVIR